MTEVGRGIGAGDPGFRGAACRAYARGKRPGRGVPTVLADPVNRESNLDAAILAHVRTASGRGELT
jgi:hypothetical protein